MKISPLLFLTFLTFSCNQTEPEKIEVKLQKVQVIRSGESAAIAIIRDSLNVFIEVNSILSDSTASLNFCIYKCAPFFHDDEWMGYKDTILCDLIYIKRFIHSNKTIYAFTLNGSLLGSSMKGIYDWYKCLFSKGLMQFINADGRTYKIPVEEKIKVEYIKDNVDISQKKEEIEKSFGPEL